MTLLRLVTPQPDCTEDRQPLQGGPDDRGRLGAWEAHRVEYALQVLRHETPDLERGLSAERHRALEAAVEEALAEHVS
jgi:hypothetical protein